VPLNDKTKDKTKSGRYGRVVPINEVDPTTTSTATASASTTDGSDHGSDAPPLSSSDPHAHAATPTTALDAQGAAETGQPDESPSGSAAALEVAADSTSPVDTSGRHGSRRLSAADSTSAVDTSSRHGSRRLSRAMSAAAKGGRQTVVIVKRATTVVASALGLRVEHSTQRAALVFLCQIMAFAVLCSVLPCYAAWCCGMDAHDRAARYFGEDAPSEPAVYREYREDRHIEHLAVAPVQPFLVLEYGATPPGMITQPLWRHALVVYHSPNVVQPFIFTVLFRPTAWATLGYAAVVLGLTSVATDLSIKVATHWQEHGTQEGSEGLAAATVLYGVLCHLLITALPVFGSSRPGGPGLTAKCKAWGGLFAFKTLNLIIWYFFHYLIFMPYFNTDDFFAKVLIRTLGTYGSKRHHATRG